MLFKKNTKLLMIGDSITDAGRARPVGEGLGEALGRGYVCFVDSLLGTMYPELAVRVVNMGNSGDTVRNLKARWKTDVLDQKPDWVSIMIGINDVWRQHDLPKQTGIHVHLDEYEETLKELVEKTLPAVRGMILITPYYIEPSRRDTMRATMDKYGAAMKRVARTHQTVFVDTQAAFDAVLEHNYPATLAWDRVHPSAVGHMVLARAFLDAAGFKWR